jgi:hypothetical protein
MGSNLNKKPFTPVGGFFCGQALGLSNETDNFAGLHEGPDFGETF